MLAGSAGILAPSDRRVMVVEFLLSLYICNPYSSADAW